MNMQYSRYFSHCEQLAEIQLAIEILSIMEVNSLDGNKAQERSHDLKLRKLYVQQKDIRTKAHRALGDDNSWKFTRRVFGAEQLRKWSRSLPPGHANTPWPRGLVQHALYGRRWDEARVLLTHTHLTPYQATVAGSSLGLRVEVLPISTYPEDPSLITVLLRPWIDPDELTPRAYLRPGNR